MNASELENRLIEFAVNVIEVVEEMPARKSTQHLVSQLLRASSSPALNYGEARGAESQSDFLHKIKIVLKELRETFNCLRIAYRVGLYANEARMKELIKENDELIAIFVTTTRTAARTVAASTREGQQKNPIKLEHEEREITSRTS